MNFYTLSTALLYAAGVLCFTGVEDKASGSLLPEWLQSSASYTRWGLLMTLSIAGITQIHRLKKDNRSHVLFITFYALLALASISNNELIRYAGMCAFTTTIPLWIMHTINKVGISAFLKTMLVTTAALVALGAYVFFGIKGVGSRYTGFALNPNAFAFINMFFIAISTMASFSGTIKGQMRLWAYALLIYCSATQLLSGSRGGLLGIVAFALIYIILMRIKLKLLLFTTIGGALAFALFKYHATEVVDRLWNISSAISDSGREILWEDAFECLESRPFTGYGTDSRIEQLGSGNAHNVYVALLLFCGYIGGSILSLIYILASTIGSLGQGRLYKHNLGAGVINAACVSYLTSLALMSFGEDAPLGVGSPWFIYILYSLGIMGAIRIQHTTMQLRKT